LPEAEVGHAVRFGDFSVGCFVVEKVGATYQSDTIKPG
jgi:hypothetical protein